MGLILSGCNNEDSWKNPLSEEQEESVEVRPEVVFAVADNRPLYHYIESQGIVEANREVQLKPRISGFVKESHIISGQKVTKGDILLTFVDDEWQYALKEAQNRYKQALSEYEIEARTQGMMESLNGTDGNMVRNDSLVRIFSGLAAAELNLERAQLDLSYTVMKAPFTGVLSTKQRIASGSYLGAGTGIGRLVDDRTVRVRFEVLEAELNRVNRGMEVELTAPGGDEQTGKVTAVSPVIDTESKTGQVVVEVDNRKEILKPGMTVEGRIRTQALTGKARIPRAAILERDGGRTLVFKLHPENNEVEWIYVFPAAQNNEWAIVNHENIEPGDTLAVDRHFALSHLQEVTPRMRLLNREEEVEGLRD